MSIGAMKAYTNNEAMTSEIASIKPTLIVFESITGVYSIHSVYTIKNGSELSIMVGSDHGGYKPLKEVLEEKMVLNYGLLNG